MSVVCAKVFKDKIVIAADSIVVSGWTKDTKQDFIKLKKINDMIIGGSGYCEEQSIMWHYMKTHRPNDNSEKSVLDFMVEFAKWKDEYSGNKTVQNNYILAFDGKLFFIEGLFVKEVNDFCAIGAGRDFALAALHLGHPPKEATKVACELSCFVAEPIIEEEMKL